MENKQNTITIKDQIEALTKSQEQRATELKRLNEVEQELLNKKAQLREQMTFTAGQIDALKSISTTTEPEQEPDTKED